MAKVSITAREFKSSQIAMGDSFVLVGTDAWLIDSVADKIREVLKSKHGADIVIIYGDEIKAPELNDTLDTYSIFSTLKLVIVKNADKLKKAELEILGKYFDAPSDTQSVLIITEKTDMTTRAWKKIRDGSTMIQCDPPRHAGDMRAWLDSILRSAGKRMDASVSATFLARVELDYASAYNELQKLFILTGKTPSITQADVMRSLGSSRVGALSDFYRALGARNAKSVLSMIEKMLASDWEGLQVFFQLVKYYNIMWKILLLRKNHISTDEIIKSHVNELYPTQKTEFVKASDQYRLTEMPDIFSALLETDSAIKLSAAPNEVLLCICALKVLEKK